MDHVQDRVLEGALQSDEAGSPLINLRDTGRFLEVLASLKCSLAISRRPSGVALLGVENGIPAETPSIATMKGGFWQTRPGEEDENDVRRD